MAHEQSVTVERDGKFFIESGVTGEQLEGPFDSLDAANSRARARSESFTPDGKLEGPEPTGQNLTGSEGEQKLEGPVPSEDGVPTLTPPPDVRTPDLELKPVEEQDPLLGGVLEPTTGFSFLFPGISVMVNTVEQAMTQQAWPTVQGMIKEVVRAGDITKKQVHQAMLRLTESEMERSLSEIKLVEGMGIDLVDNPNETAEEKVRRQIQQAQGLSNTLMERIKEEIGAPEEVPGGLVMRNLTRVGLYTPLVVATRGMGAGPIATTMFGGTLASLAAFETDEPRVTDLLTKLDNPAFNNAFTQALKSDPTDPFWKAKLKQSIEELILGATVIGGLKVGGTVVRSTIDAGQELYSSAVSLMRQRASSGVGVTEDTIGFQTLFRAGAEEADVEVAKYADDLLRQPVPDGISTDAYRTVLLENFRNQINKIARTHAQEVNGVIVKPFTSKDIDAKVNLLGRRFDKGQTPPLERSENARELKQAFEANDEAVAEASKRTLREIAEKTKNTMREAFVDRAGTVKKELLESAGDEGRRAVQMQELAMGSSHAAQRVYDQAYRRVFGDLSRSDRSDLSNLIRLRRMREIKSYQPDWEPPVVSKGKRTTIRDYDALLDDLRGQVGEVKYMRLSKAADSYFNEMAKALDVLQETGVISAQEYTKLWRFQWSPIRFIEEIDPTVATLRDGRNVISISSSGIKPLSQGHRQLMLNDPELFLGEVIGRAYSRAFRNRANVGLYNVARTHTDNPVVRLTRPRSGKDQWSELSVFVDGEKKSMFLRKDLMLGWSVDPVGVPFWISAAFGTPLIRPFATGSFAPQFGLVNFAYDTVYAMSTAGAGRLYSPLYPVAGLQLGRDLAETAADAFARKGLFNEYIERGGMMSLLTHQGRITGPRLGQVLSSSNKALNAFEHYAGYLNETTEVWVRLAIMNRALRRLKAQKGIIGPEDMDTAVWEARRYLDFGQGGMVAKKIDGIIPYTNAAIQGFRGAARATKESPVQTSIRVAQLAGLSSSVWWANHIVNPEAWADVPQYVKDSHLVLTTPFHRTDREGNRRYIYFKIPLEHTVRPIHALMNAVMARVFQGKMPENSTLNVLKSGAQIIPGVGGAPPTVNAAVALSANFDFWRGDEIWRGAKNIPPELERTTFGEDPTSRMAIDVTEGVNPILDQLGAGDLRMSPARLEVASRALVPVSPWTELVGHSYNLARDGLDDSLKEMQWMSMQEALNKTPIIKRFIGETHPFIGDLEKLRRQQEQAGGEAFRWTEELNKQVDNFLKQGEFGKREAQTISRWIRDAVPPVHQTRMMRNLQQQIKMQAVFDRYDPDKIPGMPSKTWWRVLSTDRPTTRAAGVMEVWQNIHLSLDSDDKETRELASQQRRLMRRLMATVPGFNPGESKEFAMELQRLSRDRGIPLP